MKHVVNKAYNDAIDFLFQIDDPCPAALEDDFYESLASYKIREAEKSTWSAFTNNKFYQLLPPRL